MNAKFKTFTPKAGFSQKKWFLINAAGMRVGRLSNIIANILRGKHKPSFTPNLDCGDNVVVINAKDVVFTGNKFDDKEYLKHSGYPGGLKVTTPFKLHLRGYPERILHHAVKGMVGRGPMARKRLSNLYVYADDKHSQAAQKPELIDIASLNLKNSVK